ncbi:MAG: hypothetical protein IIC60_14825 [Proteobacteria bacterium]|nr:hypothetical protein [Pseudomonadota bacterium]
MKISLITPSNKQSRAGNRTTAVRWAQILDRLGHRLDHQLAIAELLVRRHVAFSTFLLVRVILSERDHLPVHRAAAQSPGAHKLPPNAEIHGDYVSAWVRLKEH